MGRQRHRAFLLGAAIVSLAVSVSHPSRAEQAAIDLDGLTAKRAAADLCAGKITSTALTSAALARAKASQTLNAFITLDEAGAMKAAASFDAGRTKKSACKPLGGVPIVIKDNIEVAGLPTTAGTPALKGFVPREDAPVAAKLRAAGAIIIGKTNMHELAFGISGYNPTFQTGAAPGVRNAYDATKIAGGSSSGTAAAIGARIVTAGLGTDTGGSGFPAPSMAAPRSVRRSGDIRAKQLHRSPTPEIPRVRWLPPWRMWPSSTASSPAAVRSRPPT
jgi:hypothetical protein